MLPALPFRVFSRLFAAKNLIGHKKAQNSQRRSRGASVQRRELFAIRHRLQIPPLSTFRFSAFSSTRYQLLATRYDFFNFFASFRASLRP
jgi:hypothetical protein